MRDRLEYEVDGLLHGHEVALHIRIRHRHRSAMGDLFLKQRDHGAGGPQHVAEPNDAEAGRGACEFERLAIKFGCPLCRPHDARRIDGLVRRDEQEGLHLGAGGCIGHDGGPERIGLGSLDRIAFGDRDMLDSGGVENHLGPFALHDGVDAALVADVAKQL